MPAIKKKSKVEIGKDTRKRQFLHPENVQVFSWSVCFTKNNKCTFL